MRNVWLAQISHRFGDNAFLPYSVGRLWAAVPSSVRAHYRLSELLWQREPIEQVIARMELYPPDVLGLSCYIWNERYSLALAQAVADIFPGVCIVAGGPQVPSRPDRRAAWMEAHPFVSEAVNGEGERRFADILAARARVPAQVTDGDSLDDLPSPYLRGVFDGLLGEHPEVQWQAVQETHRGCPYQCTFCDWGSAVYSKVRQFPLDVICKEIDWCGRNRIDLLYNADANFGMLPRDPHISDALIACKRHYGAPTKFRAAWGKKTTPRLFEMGRALAREGMCKGVTLSVQSMDSSVLKVVKRRNTPYDEFSRLVRDYRAAGVPTYTEVILGLPGETYESFTAGVQSIIDAGQHDGLNIYPLIALENSELNDPAYRERWGIRTIELPMLLLHGNAGHDPHEERYNLVIETAHMSHEQWRRAMLFGWVVQGLHCMGLTQELVRGDVAAFYERALDLALAEPDTVLGGAVKELDELLDGVLGGWDTWNRPVSGYGPVTWPPEELLFLRCAQDVERFHLELVYGLSLDLSVAREIQSQLRLPDMYDGDLETWAREVAWYGRKGGTRRKEAA